MGRITLKPKQGLGFFAFSATLKNIFSRILSTRKVSVYLLTLREAGHFR